MSVLILPDLFYRPGVETFRLVADFLDVGDRHFAEEYDRRQVPAEIAELRALMTSSSVPRSCEA